MSCTNIVVESDFDEGSYWRSTHLQAWDSTEIVRELRGEWNWVYTQCGECLQDPPGRSTIAEEVSVRFSWASVELIRKGKVVQSSAWTVVKRDGDLFGLAVNPPIGQLHGRILLKNENVCFCNSYVDGSDNFFIRK